MAEPDHLRHLERGVKHWNRWRSEQPDIIPDLTDAVMTGKNLIGIDFRACRLERAHFWRCICRKGMFNGANLRDALFDISDFKAADFSGADMTRIRIIRCALKGARLTGTHLRMNRFPVYSGLFNDRTILITCLIVMCMILWVVVDLWIKD